MSARRNDMLTKMTRIKITNYRGIATLEAEVEGAGLLAKGRNGSGKTSVLNAIGAALAASDIGPDAVKLGEESGEILIDLDRAGQALTVRRKFGAKGSTLSVTNADGDTKAKPATLLGELLGQAPLDVVSMVLEKDAKKRKELILAALPVRVTVEQIRRWVPACPDNVDVSGHGLEVIERLRKVAYDKRTEANKTAKAKADDAARAHSHAEAMKVRAPAESIPVSDAKEKLEYVERELAKTEARREAAAKALASQAGLRSQVEDLRERATTRRKVVAEAPSDAEITAAWHCVEEAAETIRRLEQSLSEAKDEHGERCIELTGLKDRKAEAKIASARADEEEAQADKIEESLKSSVDTITDEQIEAARAEVKRADDVAKGALAAFEASLAEKDAAAAKAEADTAAAEAARLDAVVKALTQEAPAALLAESGGIAGLQIDGDDVRIDGVSLDKLCGAEQMNFAAKIAQRLHPGVGFLIADGLERLDPEQLDHFVAAVTADGRQLFGSMVDRGDFHLVKLDAPAVDIAAEEE